MRLATKRCSSGCTVRSLARDRTYWELPKCNITPLAEYRKVSASGFAAMRRSAKCNRKPTLLRVFGLHNWRYHDTLNRLTELVCPPANRKATKLFLRMLPMDQRDGGLVQSAAAMHPNTPTGRDT